MGVGFQLCQPQNKKRFQSHRKHFIWSKTGRNSAA